MHDLLYFNSKVEVFLRETITAETNNIILKSPWEFHESLPFYKETPLLNFRPLANTYGVKAVYVKDESNRFGLNSFKPLGAGYAINELKEQIKAENKKVICATAGNHGIGVSFFCKYFGIANIVLIPKGLSKIREKVLRSLGSEVIRTNLEYDGTVDLMKHDKKYRDFFKVADTGWGGYERIPKLIQIGYYTMFYETLDELIKNSSRDILIMLQGGVGTFASSCIDFFISQLSKFERIQFCIVESSEANCLQESAKNKKYTSVKVNKTKATCIACGDPNPLVLNQILENASHYISCGDKVIDKGLNIFKKFGLKSTHTGAISIGVLNELITNNNHLDLREEIEINTTTTLLMFNTESEIEYNNI